MYTIVYCVASSYEINEAKIKFERFYFRVFSELDKKFVDLIKYKQEYLFLFESPQA